ncbi:hypothetical protein KAI87_01415 [Myxococcota bacterium]|nr:hypothetical protein [Myxococcota bacterium]
MTSVAHRIESEIAYDLLQDHVELILALLDAPMSHDEVVEKLASQKVDPQKILKRLIRHELISQEGNTISARASAYHQMRQENMITFLERYVLPALTATSANTGFGNTGFARLENRYLHLPAKSIKTLRQHEVQKLLEALVEVSDAPATGLKTRQSVLVIGTSRVLPAALTPERRALDHLKQASLQRSISAEAPQAFLTQFDFLADNDRFLAATTHIEDFLLSLDAQVVDDPHHANYHLTLACHRLSSLPRDTGMHEPDSEFLQ